MTGMRLEYISIIKINIIYLHILSLIIQKEQSPNLPFITFIYLPLDVYIR